MVGNSHFNRRITYSHARSVSAFSRASRFSVARSSSSVIASGIVIS
jgi:hypothetical protein